MSDQENDASRGGETEDTSAEIEALLQERAEIDVAYRIAQAEKEAATVFMDQWRIAHLRQVPLVDRDVSILLRLMDLGAEPGELGWDIVDDRNGGRLGGIMTDWQKVDGDQAPVAGAEQGDD